MNDWNLLVECRPDVTPPDDDTYRRMKMTLEHTIDHGGGGRQVRGGWMTAAIGVAIVAAVVVGVGRETGPGGMPAARAVEVRPVGEYLEITFNDLTVPADQVNQQISEFGVDVEVVFVPASPSMVGSVPWVDGPDAGFFWEFGNRPSVKLPAVLDGRVMIGIGVPTPPGERYESSAISAEIKGEALGCQRVTFGLASEAQEIARRLGVTVEWSEFMGAGIGDSLPDEHLGWYVVGTYPLADGLVAIDLAPDLSFISEETINLVTADLYSGC